MVSKAHPSAARPASPPPRPAGSGKMRNLSIRQEEKGLCTTSPGEGNGEDSVWLTGVALAVPLRGGTATLGQALGNMGDPVKRFMVLVLD
ncbi:hypothetical protein CC2G_006725 [Coprinopsis cinerea AmutBmut pab1-1]|nr:hypothetical protein CC2G_006725 [Coprinopsis cinerea AmutBmut pab1-1]